MTRSRSSPRRAPLTRERILAEALRLVDEQGLEALTMRGLGARLGVEAMALYHHLPGKEAVLDGILELLVAEVEVPEAGAWDARLRAVAGSYRRVALAHPRAFLLVLTRPYLTEGLLAYCDRLLRIFLDAGLPAAEAAQAFRWMGHYLDGATLYVSQGPAAGGAPPPAPVDPVRFPALAACRPHLARAKAAEHFAHGVERMVADLQRRVQELRGDRQDRGRGRNGKGKGGAH